MLFSSQAFCSTNFSSTDFSSTDTHSADSEHSSTISSPANLTETQSPHRLFMSAAPSSGEQFDEWRVDTGYAYSVFDNIDLYVATRISSSEHNENRGSINRGFLSGVNYHFNHKLSLNSAIYASPDSEAVTISDYIGAELSGKYMLTDNLNLKATVDYEEWQSAIEVKLGFSF
ncbi:hypothetical protein A9264_07715 [Vibrio sp. UCD-FRSSP16_10]|nr:hypothetical protein A9260_08500 [Vibrio sp. UCD-FRSSP16_30]OBT12869.1 hypothetical protein A9264_07715 [Vibrio sp. UCD-FRSSP16_10]